MSFKYKRSTTFSLTIMARHFLLCVLFFSITVHVRSLPNGVCNEYQRFNDESQVSFNVTFCCYHFYKRNGNCVECPIGHYSKGEECKKCTGGQYGRKCAETCSCNTTERCDHVTGCVAKYDRRDTTVTIENYPSGSQVTVDYMEITSFDTHDRDTVANDIVFSITLREIIFFVVILFLGLLVCLGLMYMCRKRQKQILITPRANTEVNSDTVIHRQTEERSESMYDEIDESAISETLSPIVIGAQFHNTYLEVTNSPCNTFNVKDNLTNLCMSRFPSQCQMVEQTSKSGYSLRENIPNDLHFQTTLGHYYSDGYLRPETTTQRHHINRMMENQEILFSNEDRVAGQENDRHVYDRPAYDGIVRSAGYDRLRLPKDERKLTNGSMFVQKSIYPSNRQLANKYKHSELATYFSKRSTI